MASGRDCASSHARAFAAVTFVGDMWYAAPVGTSDFEPASWLPQCPLDLWGLNLRVIPVRATPVGGALMGVARSALEGEEGKSGVSRVVARAVTGD